MQKILIVDDEPVIREILSDILTNIGYDILTAPGGRECMDCLSQIVPDLVLLDIMMEPVDGWQTLSLIRNNQGTRTLLVIMFSGKSPSREEIARYGGWLSDYLMKPLTIETILETLDKVFRRNLSDADIKNHYIQSGGDPALADEYFCLRNRIFLYRKFFGDPGAETEGISSIDETRLKELSHILAAE